MVLCLLSSCVFIWLDDVLKLTSIALVADRASGKDLLSLWKKWWPKINWWFKESLWFLRYWESCNKPLWDIWRTQCYNTKVWVKSVCIHPNHLHAQTKQYTPITLILHRGTTFLWPCSNCKPFSSKWSTTYTDMMAKITYYYT